MNEAGATGALPDFIIAGAMKCGTTSLYHDLKGHPDIFIPPLEIGFFDIDEIRQHPDFFKFRRGRWHAQSFDPQDRELIGWYRGLFRGAEPGQVKGERSVTYIASSLVPRRIRSLQPDAKIIVMLRDPVLRAYSNYWHLLRIGEVSSSFEHSLRYRHNALFERGLYRTQIERYLAAFPREQLLFVLFEDYIEDPQRCLTEVSDFLGVDAEKLLQRDEENWENRGRYPWIKSLQYATNAVLFHGLLDGHRYLDSHLPHLQSKAVGYGPISRAAHSAATFAFKVLSRLNCSRGRRPTINPDTKRLLKYLYESQNEGLSDLIGRDLSAVWPVTKV